MGEYDMVNSRFNPNVISKAFAIIRAFTDEKSDWGVNELARYLEIPVSSLHRNLKTLRDENILGISAQTGKYTIGPELVRMASIISSQVEIKQVARTFMEEISSTISESVYLGLYHPQYRKISFVEGVHSQNPLQYVLEIGVLQSIHIAASGKVVLAHLDDDEIQRIFEKEAVDIDEQEQICDEIKLIREQGYMITLGERLAGASGTAAPIFDSTQKVIGCITCVIPLNHYDEKQKYKVAKKVMEGAAKISYVLGYKQD